MHLVVIGAGVAGSCAARLARERGWRVTLVSDGQPPASAAALAVVRPSWFPDEPEHTYARNSLALLARWGAVRARTAFVTTERDLEAKILPGYFLVDTRAVLEKPDLIADSGFTPWQHPSQDAATVTLDARGVGGPVPHEPLWGATLVSRDVLTPGLGAGTLRVHRLRPYVDVHIANFGNEVRLGSTSCKTAEQAVERVQDLAARALAHGFVTRGTWEPIVGLRAMAVSPTLPEAGARHAVIGGLGKNGYALAPGAVNAWLNSITPTGAA